MLKRLWGMLGCHLDVSTNLTRDTQKPSEDYVQPLHRLLKYMPRTSSTCKQISKTYNRQINNDNLPSTAAEGQKTDA